MDFNLQSLAQSPEKKEQPSIDVADLRHQAMMKAIEPYAKPTQQKNLTPVYIDYKTRKTKLILALCPEWAPMFPPFNLARLSGVAKTAGYETHIMDINIRAHNEYMQKWSHQNLIPFRLWDPSAFWHWTGDTYWKDIHPVLQPLLEQCLDEMLAMNPDVIGFSVYNTSERPTIWLCEQIKKRAPHIKIIVGGSNAQKSWFRIDPTYDYVVNGEGEEAILKILDEIEQGVTHQQMQYIAQPENQRININGLPMPDYESIDFSLYQVPNGVNSEISRGCTAKCTFCEETHFWKYRQRQAVDLITEVEWLYYNKGTDIIWFIDSLINGNLKELRAFALACKAKNLKVRWTGYARCDGRMDLDYLRDLAEGGCIMFNFGCESGSQHVLDDMDKGVTVKEMEQNFIDCKKVGIWAATNWIVGFPTETIQDFADTMTFIWRMRNNNINNIGAGIGFGLGPETIVGQNPEKFNLSHQKYQGHWITKDFSLGGTHVMSRVKTFHMFLDFLKGTTDFAVGYPIRFNLEKEHYVIKLNNPTTIREVEYEQFDYNIIKVDYNPYAKTLVNEMWPFFRMLWKTRGGYTAEVKFNPDIDMREFGNQYGPGMLDAVYKFEITDDGKWSADFDIKFTQVKLINDEKEPWRTPFYAQDFSRIYSNTALRARKLAKPSWSLEKGRNDMEFWAILQEEDQLNKVTDWSFTHHYVAEGDWGSYQQYETSVSNQMRLKSIPEKDQMFQEISLDKIKRKISNA